jgi:methylenetetrahydrofolate dehydrogenase (NADP+)/methenyltetrahydrofolate cyclohydrolase
MAWSLDVARLREQVAGGKPGIMSGRAVSAALLEQVADAARGLARPPGLVVVQVGDDVASGVYIRQKIKAAVQVGVDSRHLHLPHDVTQHALEAELAALNADARCDGVLLQLPLPAHLDAAAAIAVIAPEKDADGFHPYNLGRLMAWQATVEPCTPRGVMTMLAAYGVELVGREAVVVGRSMIVGRPMGQLLMRAGATVTMCHSKTRDVAAHVGAADIVVAAVGVAELIKGAWIKPGAVVIDVGINRAEGGGLVGDVEFAAARERAAWITPVPGGVGPMTVATLMENVVSARLRASS